MKRDDPKLVKLRAERDRTGMRVELLSKGLAGVLTNGYWSSAKDLPPLFDAFNEFVDAVKAHEKANETYRPYRRPSARFHPAQVEKNSVRPT